MVKSSEIKLVGQPILKQIMDLLSVVDLKGLSKRHQADRYYKRFSSRTHLTTLLFGILSRCDSMGEICEGMRAMGGKLNHLGLDSSPAKSTACDGNRSRSASFFESVYFELVKHYSSFLSDSRTFGLTFKEVLLIDSTTIRLFSDIMKGVGRNPKGDGKKKGGLKVHMLIDAVQQIGKFIKVTEAKVNDHEFLKELELKPFSMVVFDKAYNDYMQFARWTTRNIYFVTRQKTDAAYKVIALLRKHNRLKGKAKVLKEELIKVEYKPEEKAKEKQPLILRRICYQDEQNRPYVFLTNTVSIEAEEVALLYKKRWTIELLFKKMKQNFQLHYFYGETENAIRTQIWCTLIAQLLMTVIQKQAGTKKAFPVIATLVRIHLISLLDMYELLRATRRVIDKKKHSPPQSQGQLSLNW
jgi:hypothetical protein